MKILAFGASNSKNSINKKLAEFIANQLVHSEKKIIDLNDYETVIFSPERKLLHGAPQLIKDFVEEIEIADFIIISFAEYNGSYTAAFKNIFDWATQIKNNLFEQKSVFLSATSTGSRGGQTVLEAALQRFPRHGAHIMGSFSLPFFYENFDFEKGITNIERLNSLQKQLKQINR